MATREGNERIARMKARRNKPLDPDVFSIEELEEMDVHTGVMLNSLDEVRGIFLSKKQKIPTGLAETRDNLQYFNQWVRRVLEHRKQTSG